MLKKDILLIKHLLAHRKTDEIRDILKNLHPADIAQILGEMKNENKDLFFESMDIALTAEVLEEIEPIDRLHILQGMSENEIVRILENMSVDEIIDLLQEMPSSRVELLLSKLPKDDYEELKSLLKLAEDTAGGIMTTDYVYIYADNTVRDAIEDIRKFGHKAETIYYIYVVDEKRHLTGVISLRELIVAPRDHKISDIMVKKVVSVDVDLDQEEVARVISRYSLLAVPVVNKEHRLLGIITVDDALDVIEEELTEDIHKMAGITPERDTGLTTSILGEAKKRLFWLVICLIGDMASGVVIDRYSHLLQSVVSVAFFIPVLMASGGNVGTQSLALSVRGLATGELERKNVRSFLAGETIAGLLVGLISGFVLFVFSFLWQRDINLSWAVGIAMSISLMLSALLGVLIPMVFNFLHIDPAVASGPFITTVVDVMTLIIYFTLSRLLLTQILHGTVFSLVPWGVF